MTNYANPSKLERAKKFAKEQGKENDEATIKARYIALGGLIIGEDEASDEKVEVSGRMKREKLEEIAREEGISDEDIEACEKNGDLADLINARREGE